MTRSVNPFSCRARVMRVDRILPLWSLQLDIRLGEMEKGKQAVGLRARRDQAHAPRAHPPVERFGVRVALDTDSAEAEGGGGLDGVLPESLSVAAPDRRRFHEEINQLRLVC